MIKKICLCLVGIFIFLSFFFSPKNTVRVQGQQYLVGDMTVTSDSYLLQDSYVKFVKPKTDQTTFLSAFQITNATMNLECNNKNSYVATGCSMKVEDLSKQVTSYSVVVLGDVTGDGEDTLTDIVKIATYAKDQSGLSAEASTLAADFDNDQSVSSKDTNSLAYYAISKEELPNLNDPSLGTEVEILTKTLILSKGSSSKIETKVSNGDTSIIEWTSSNEKIVSVDSTGLVTGVGAGEATITVKTSTGSTASMQVDIIVVVPATGITLNTTSLQMNVGESNQLSATVSPSDATNKTVTWKSSDTSIATVDGNGLVKALSNGTVTITATTATGKTATTTINVVVPATKVTLDQTSLNMVKGVTATLTATITPSNVTNSNITWSSSNTNVATVDGNGKVTAVGNGLALITATSGDGTQSATCNVTVEALQLTLSSSAVTLVDEKAKVITATLSSNAVDQTITWTSSDTSIATVDSSGKVKAKGVGSATITATSKFDTTVTATCTITVQAARVLFVGNSKTYKPGTATSDNGIPKRVKAIANNAGYTIEYVYAGTGGASLEEIYTDYLSTITSKKFDYVVVQEKTATYSASNITDYYNGVQKIANKVKEKNNSAKIYIRKLWVKSNSTSSVITTAYNNTTSIASKIKTNEGYDVGIINDGETFYEVLNNYSDTITIFQTDDLVHQNAKGAYLSALCIYSTLFGNDPTKITYDASIDSDIASTLKTIAKKYCYSS